MSLTALLICMSAQSGLATVAKVTHEPIDEMSGIVKSRRWEGVYWVHNDSGDDARIFAIRADGSVVMPGHSNRKEDAGKVQPVPTTYGGLAINNAVNTDWEDIAYDGQNLYIADLGNNNNARRDMAVYVVAEPNPYDAQSATPITRYPVAYIDQTSFPPEGERPFDCEAVFARGGNLYFLTKHRNGPIGLPVDNTNLYVLSLRTARADRVNPLRKVASAKGLGGWVTAADVSPDGKKLAVLTQAPGQALFVYDLQGADSSWLNRPQIFKFEGGKQCEAVCWDDEGVVRITNEQRDVFTLRVR